MTLACYLTTVTTLGIAFLARAQPNYDGPYPLAPTDLSVTVKAQNGRLLAAQRTLTQLPLDAANDSGEITWTDTRSNQAYYGRVYIETDFVYLQVQTSDGLGAKPSGFYREAWPNLRQLTFGTFMAGVPTGEWTRLEFDSSGIQTCLDYERVDSPAALAEALQRCSADSRFAGRVTVVTETYRDGKREGAWTEHRASHPTADTITYRRGEKRGRAVTYDTSGALLLALDYRKGEIADTLLDQRPKRSHSRGKLVERMPAFPEPTCGDYHATTNPDELATAKQCREQAMLQYIYTSVKYPEIARENGYEGKAVVSFVIEKDGRLSDVHSVRFTTRSIDEETVRVIRSMPRWIPGYQYGEPVRVAFTMPIVFKLE